MQEVVLPSFLTLVPMLKPSRAKDQTPLAHSWWCLLAVNHPRGGPGELGGFWQRRCCSTRAAEHRVRPAPTGPRLWGSSQPGALSLAEPQRSSSPFSYRHHKFPAPTAAPPGAPTAERKPPGPQGRGAGSGLGPQKAETGTGRGGSGEHREGRYGGGGSREPPVPVLTSKE